MKWKYIIPSILLHILILFYINAFHEIHPTVVQSSSSPIEVEIYEVSNSGGGGGSNSNIESNDTETSNDIIDNSKSEIVNKKTIINHISNNKVITPNQSSSETGSGSGIGSGQGNGVGSGSGSGVGSGDGNGVGSGTEDDRDTLTPKTPPILINSVSPIYPDNLRLRNISGVVKVKILVSENGTVINAEVSSSSGYNEMDNAAINAVYGYIFNPALNSKGNPVQCYITTSIRFKIE